MQLTREMSTRWELVCEKLDGVTFRQARGGNGLHEVGRVRQRAGRGTLNKEGSCKRMFGGVGFSGVGVGGGKRGDWMGFMSCKRGGRVGFASDKGGVIIGPGHGHEHCGFSEVSSMS